MFLDGSLPLEEDTSIGTGTNSFPQGCVGAAGKRLVVAW